MPEPLAGADRAGRRALVLLRQLLSGHIGDYVSWLAVGVAGLARVLAWAVVFS